MPCFYGFESGPFCVIVVLFKYHAMREEKTNKKKSC